MFSGCEINSTFRKTHRPATFARWAASVPPGFRFSLKVPAAITHEARLAGCLPLLETFVADTAPLGSRVFLVQLPPSLEFSLEVVRPFFGAFRERYSGGIACEPRHASWTGEEVDDLFASFRVARVMADPLVVPGSGWKGLSYFRWHGSPRAYYSAYSDAAIADLASRVQGCEGEVWCIFDNTAAGEAIPNAWQLLSDLAEEGAPGSRNSVL